MKTDKYKGLGNMLSGKPMAVPKQAPMPPEEPEMMQEESPEREFLMSIRDQIDSYLNEGDAGESDMGIDASALGEE